MSVILLHDSPYDGFSNVFSHGSYTFTENGYKWKRVGDSDVWEIADDDLSNGDAASTDYSDAGNGGTDDVNFQILINNGIIPLSDLKIACELNNGTLSLEDVGLSLEDAGIYDYSSHEE